MTSPKSPETLLIRGGRLIDPENRRDGEFDLLVAEGKVARVGKSLAAPAGAQVIDAKGLIVAPGLVDIHVHLREPGNEGAETIESGTRAAAAGGVTSVVAMPNTQPPIDNVSGVRFLLRRAAETATVRVWPTGAITVGRSGERLAEIGAMAEAGAVAVTDDGNAVPETQLLRRALDYAKMFDLTVIEHAEDKSLMADGVMNEGPLATRLGHKGIPRQAESIAVARDIALAELTGAHLHVTHISTRESVDLIRAAKRRGVRVTSDATPHHFTLTEDAILRYGPNAKMNPPLRTEADRKAIIEGLVDGTIDAIASDHAPHTRASKEQEFSAAPFGIIGLETLLPLTVTQLIEPGHLSWPDAIRRLCSGPAKVLSLPVGDLGEGQPADLVVIDPTEERTVSGFSSKSQNSPFLGWTLRGFPQLVLVEGRVVLRREALRAAPAR
ncbi:MAG TPA: dihydroorotase [Elusimicrobiota bacterium]|nr:dihydroorotase [Elusimicrobiota bacterium]HMX43308.1 dihydroorotase [Elusimicrobiota bacterium]HNA59816.1 dihydroorotase [Elusimicrobiota bacterium]HNC74404.1 dihydroorotase [Elusimicrobiota bacterium]HND63396.1 dihydroorotase [Elusimicrobiota bacterium]